MAHMLKACTGVRPFGQPTAAATLAADSGSGSVAVGRDPTDDMSRAASAAYDPTRRTRTIDEPPGGFGR